jgi:hypothetical protein
VSFIAMRQRSRRQWGFLSHIRHGHIVFQDGEDSIPIRRIDAVYNIVNKLIAGEGPDVYDHEGS